MAQQSEEFKGKVDESLKGEKDEKEQSVFQQKDNNAGNNEDKPKIQSQPQSLFSGLNPQLNLFNNSGINLKPGQLFTGSILNTSIQQQPSQLSQLFNNTNIEIKSGNTEAKLNQQQSQSAQKKDENSDEEDDDLDSQQHLSVDLKYEYTSDTDQIIKQDLEKFRRNTNEILEKGTASIEKAKNEQNYFFVYRNQTQQIIYSGQLLKGLSETKPLGQKQENLILKAVSKKEQVEQKESQSVDDKKNLIIDTLKLMFATKQGADEFKKELEKALQ